MNIYVGNLPWGVTGDKLRDLFENHGEVATASVIEDKFTGKSKGFGFVEMPNKEEAEAAIAALNGEEMEGRAIVVNEARPRAEGGGGRGGRGGGGGRGGRGGFGGGGGRGGHGGGGHRGGGGGRSERY